MKSHPIYTRYLISETGDVIDSVTNCKRNTYPHTNGYIQVSIFDENGILKMKRIHRLVAETYLIESKYYGLDVNHIDGDKTNNCVNNLEWCTRSYNIKHAKRLGLNSTIGETHFNTNLTNSVVHEICKDLCNGLCSNEISIKYCIDKSVVANIKNGRSWVEISDLYSIPKIDKPRLNKDDIISLYLDYNSGNYSIDTLSDRYSVSKETVKRIGNKKTHRNIIDNALNDYRNHT